MSVLLEIDDPHVAPHKRDEYLNILRAIPSGRIIEAVCKLNDLQRDLLIAGVRELHPELSDREVNAKIAWLWLPEDLWEKAYGPQSPYMNKEQ